MKRLMLTALMGCVLMSQIKASDMEWSFRVAGQEGLKNGLILGAALPIVAGGIVALGTQATHMNFQNFTNGQSGPNIFFSGLDKTNIRPNTFFAQGEPIPCLGYRFAHWTKIASFCGCGLAALAKLYSVLYPSMKVASQFSAHGNFVKDATICGSLLTTATLAYFISEGLKPRTIELTRNDA